MVDSLPLPYGTLKSLHNGPDGRTLNPFFGKWKKLDTIPPNFAHYRYLLDTSTSRAYVHPPETVDGITRLSSQFVDPSGRMIPVGQIARHIPRGTTLFHADTCDGPYLIAASASTAADPTALAAAAYKTLVAVTPLRAVESSDRQVHWVWFRKTPAWRLTEEIVLRAASWIELNPGYQFHLWTNLIDAVECTDFLADLPTPVRERYFSPTGDKIQVHYSNEFRETIFTWLATHASPAVQEQFTAVWDSTERQDIVMKTDYTRNILLAVHGGIYADFNDLLCLAPIEPLLAVHAGRFVGVCDNTTPQSASNYFMYAARGNPEWNEIVVRCTETLPEVRETIYDVDALQLARQLLQQAQEGRPLAVSAIQAQLDASPLRSARVMPRHFLYSLCMAVELAHERNSPTATAIGTFLRTNRSRRATSTFTLEVGALLGGCDIATFLAPENTEIFARAWRFARTDMYLNTIMHRSNLPIFCRQKEIPLFQVPFSYLLRYACLFSFVGHLGDGGSYGMDPQRKSTIRQILNVSTSNKT